MQQHITDTIKQVRAILRKVPAQARMGSYQRAQRHAKDAAMLLKRGASEAALEKAMLAREAANSAEALGAWA